MKLFQVQSRGPSLEAVSLQLLLLLSDGFRYQAAQSLSTLLEKIVNLVLTNGLVSTLGLSCSRFTSAGGNPGAGVSLVFGQTVLDAADDAIAGLYTPNNLRAERREPLAAPRNFLNGSLARVIGMPLFFAQGFSSCGTEH